MTNDDKLTQLLMEAAKGGTSDLIMGDEVEFHPGSSIILPNGMTYSRARSILDRMQEEAETVRNHSRHYLYRPYDGAVAVAAVMKSMFGVVIGAQSGGGFFSPPEPPETKTVKVSPTETIEVPWGRVIIPALDKTEVHIHGVRHPEHGVISYVEIYTPKKYADKAKAFLDAIDEHLRTKSIYRGKAIVGTEEPEFMDLDTIRPEEIVFSDEVLSTLEGTLWSVLRHREVLKADGVRIKRALLLEGPYGTGKTSAGQLTALEAVQNGWTFIAARPGRDNINEVLRTAKLYQPAVVFIEDVDNQTSTSDKDEVAQLLETFDGVTGKGSELALLMTTNHFERIHKGMLRPGRIDAIVEVAGLDRAGVERLVRAVVSPDRLAADVDFDKVYEAMTIEIHGEKIEFYPAFIREALERAKTFAIGRLDGNLGYMLDTADLVGAAKSLHNQIRAQYNADEGIADLTIDEQLRQLVDGRLDNVQVLDEYGDDGGRLQVKK